MKRNIFIFVILCCFTQQIFSQNEKESFQKYRERLLSDFQNFRKSILDDYEKFLGGEWKEREMFEGLKSYPLPKPNEQPSRDEDDPVPSPKTIEPENVTPVEPVAPHKPPQQKPVVPNPQNMIQFEWCGLIMQLPDAKISSNLKSTDKDDIIDFFNILRESCIEKDVIPQIITIAQSSNFNDWCVLLLIESYVRKIKSNSNVNTRNFIIWYMLLCLEYDVRPLFNGKTFFYMVHMPFDIYARTYLTFNNKKYYIYGEGRIDKNVNPNSPDITGDADLYPINPIISKPLNIPYRAKRFSHTFSGCTLSGSVNENLINILNKFPQMPIPCYALSEGDPKARKQILDQMGKFIYGMSDIEAANFILQFLQSFEYATDDEQFGYEKPFFIEETLFYPKCDCEDRAIFYYFLVSNLLRNDVHLVSFPNHECNAVNFSQKLNADCYIYQGKQYVICDPTYIGASIGMCMPDFRNVKPEIELTK